MQTPKPHPPTTDPVRQGEFHAREARRRLDLARAADTTADDRELHLLDAIASALVSLAFIQLNPPPRRWREPRDRTRPTSTPTREARA